MFNEALSQCPVCHNRLERGFSFRVTPLSLITTEQMKKFIVGGEDLNEVGWMKKLLPSKAEFNLSYHCPSCKIYIVDYSRAVSREEANELANSL